MFPAIILFVLIIVVPPPSVKLLPGPRRPDAPPPSLLLGAKNVVEGKTEAGIGRLAPRSRRCGRLDPSQYPPVLHGPFADRDVPLPPLVVLQVRHGRYHVLDAGGGRRGSGAAGPSSLRGSDRSVLHEQNNVLERRRIVRPQLMPAVAQYQQEDLDVDFGEAFDQRPHDVVHEHAMHDVVIVQIAQDEGEVRRRLVREGGIVVVVVVVVIAEPGRRSVRRRRTAVVVVAAFAVLTPLSRRVQFLPEIHHAPFDDVPPQRLRLLIGPRPKVHGRNARRIDGDQPGHDDVRDDARRSDVRPQGIVHVAGRVDGVQPGRRPGHRFQRIIRESIQGVVEGTSDRAKVLLAERIVVRFGVASASARVAAAVRSLFLRRRRFCLCPFSEMRGNVLFGRRSPSAVPVHIIPVDVLPLGRTVRAPRRRASATVVVAAAPIRRIVVVRGALVLVVVVFAIFFHPSASFLFAVVVRLAVFGAHVAQRLALHRDEVLLLVRGR
mmetsp:Transcript_33193/g.98635  ORF Transcript_33193/g.98635 Transcript_33193/m.98635 type:complete len:492 (-) Transcript_33193:96-1571(-)